MPIPRVLFLSSCVRGGGAGYSLYYLLKHLDRRRIDPIVVLPDTGIFAQRLADLGVRVVTPARFPERTAQQRFSRQTPATAALSQAWNLAESAWLVPVLARLIRDEQVDLVYCNNMMVKPIGALAASLARVPCVLHVRNLHETPLAVGLYCKTVARLPAVKRVIANSAASAVPYQRAVPDKVAVVHNGVDLSEYDTERVTRDSVRKELGTAAGDLLIGFTGNLIPRKGVDVLIRAAARLKTSHPHLRYVIAGRVPIGSPVDYLASYTSLCAELGVLDRFHFLGFVSDVPTLVAGVDVLVLPSLQEPFGRSIIEAMALGTPIIASRVGGIPEILEHDLDGLLVPPGDDAALAGALARLADDPELRRTIAARAKHTVRTRFDVAKLTREMERLLLQAAAKGPTADLDAHA